MKFENLDKLFELYVQEAVRKNKEKYSSHEALEDDLGMLFNRFENVRIKPCLLYTSPSPRDCS